MAEKELAILLTAKDMASRTIGKVSKSIDSLGSRAKAGAATAMRNIGVAGVAAAGVIGFAIKTGIDNLTQLETATSSVAGAIKQMGIAGQVSAEQIGQWSVQIESAVGSAFDDKDILKATSTLIRFGKVAPSNLRPAMVVMTDLAVKTGDVGSASALLAKALADPEKAAGKLARTGVVLTKAQQDEIKAFVKAGQMAKAQQVILDSLAKTTAGAAAASQGPYARAQAELKDAVEEGTKALAVGFLPVLEKVSGFLKNKLADPAVLNQIKGFGQGLADAFDSVLTFATKIPWDAVGNALKIAGTGAKAVLDAFVAMPPWVQTAVITGWGLNKLTGGAVQGIVGQLASGLIKGVLGMNAGVVNINAGVVNGGIPTVLSGAGAVGGLGLGTIFVGLAAGAVAASAALIALGAVADATSTAEQRRQTVLNARQQEAFKLSGGRVNLSTSQSGAINAQTGFNMNALQRNAITAMQGNPDRLEAAAATIGPAIERGIGTSLRRLNSTWISRILNEGRVPTATSAEQQGILDRAHEAGRKPKGGLIGAAVQATWARDMIRAAQLQKSATDSVRGAVDRSAGLIIGAIKGSQPTVNVNVTASDVVRIQNQRRRTVKPHGPRHDLI